MNIVDRMTEVVRSRHWDKKVGHVYTWTILNWSWLRLHICVQTHSDEEVTFRSSRARMLWFVFKGAMHLHRPASSEHGTTGYKYVEGDGEVRFLDMIYAPAIVKLQRSELYFIELLPARSIDERTFDMVRWMKVGQYDLDTERQAWWLCAEVGRA